MTSNIKGNTERFLQRRRSFYHPEDSTTQPEGEVRLL